MWVSHSSVPKEIACNAGDPGSILGSGLEKEMATHSSILSWRIPMDRGAWKATAHGATRVGQDLAIKPPLPGRGRDSIPLHLIPSPRDHQIYRASPGKSRQLSWTTDFRQHLSLIFPTD